MLRNTVLKNIAFVGSGKKGVRNIRQAAAAAQVGSQNTTDNNAFSTAVASSFKTGDEIKSDTVLDAIRILTDSTDVRKLSDEIMAEKFNDFEVSSTACHLIHIFNDYSMQNLTLHEHFNFSHQKLIIEAKLSINDCVEGAEDNDLVDDDKETAKDAVREAVDVFSDINYDFQKSFNDGGDNNHSEIIQNMSSQLEELKNELDSVLGETKRGNLLLGLDNITKRIMYWKS